MKSVRVGQLSITRITSRSCIATCSPARLRIVATSFVPERGCPITKSILLAMVLMMLEFEQAQQRSRRDVARDHLLVLGQAAPLAVARAVVTVVVRAEARVVTSARIRRRERGRVVRAIAAVREAAERLTGV